MILILQLDLEKNNIKIALGSNWYSGRPETTPINTEIDASNPAINYNIPNNKHLSYFFKVNFSSTYKWENASGMQYKLGLSILNVLNQKNEINEYYRISSWTIYFKNSIRRSNKIQQINN